MFTRHTSSNMKPLASLERALPLRPRSPQEHRRLPGRAIPHPPALPPELQARLAHEETRAIRGETGMIPFARRHVTLGAHLVRGLLRARRERMKRPVQRLVVTFFHGSRSGGPVGIACPGGGRQLKPHRQNVGWARTQPKGGG